MNLRFEMHPSTASYAAIYNLEDTPTLLFKKSFKWTFIPDIFLDIQIDKQTNILEDVSCV